jgi:hypothetical protein
MPVIERVAAQLRQYPALACRVEGNTLTVEPAGAAGFPASLSDAGAGFVVALAGWRQSFRCLAGALECFALGLTPACRLRVCRRGRVAYRWTLQHRRGDTWTDDSTTGRLLYPFWRRREVIYLQNGTAPEGPR